MPKKTFRALAKKRGDQGQKERKIARIAVSFFVFNKDIRANKMTTVRLDEDYIILKSGITQ